MPLDEAHQHPAAGAWVQEDPSPLAIFAGLRIDQLQARRLHLGDGRLQVIDPEADVVQSRAAVPEELLQPIVVAQERPKPEARRLR